MAKQADAPARGAGEAGQRMDIPEVRLHAVALVFVEIHPGIEYGVSFGFLEFVVTIQPRKPKKVLDKVFSKFP